MVGRAGIEGWIKAQGEKQIESLAEQSLIYTYMLICSSFIQSLDVNDASRVCNCGTSRYQIESFAKEPQRGKM